MSDDDYKQHGGHPPAPPQLIFDDGSRILKETLSHETNDERSMAQDDLISPRGNIPLHEYYEIERISNEILDFIQSRLGKNDENSDKDMMFRVAIQFPDELLKDSPEVCWLLEDQLIEIIEKRKRCKAATDGDNNNNNNNNVTKTCKITPFCFVLGDTTMNSCCPDEVAALHLNADILVHYGHACFSPTGKLPVIYSFGKLDFDIETAIEQFENGITQRKTNENNKFLILYQVGYHHAMKELQSQWIQKQSHLKDNDSEMTVLIGEIPASQSNFNSKSPLRLRVNSSCCQSRTEGDGNDGTSCCSSATNTTSCCVSDAVLQTSDNQEIHNTPINAEINHHRLVIGGLELPESIAKWDDLSDFTIIFIMTSSDDETKSNDDTPNPQNRQYVNSMLTFLSLSNPPRGGYWIYSPPTKSLSTDIIQPPSLHRQLKRRFFLTQKARDANVFGILVSNLSQQHLVQVVQSIQKLIQRSNKTYYSFAVGRINPAKLANFAEIDIFCLVACREHSILDNERDYPVPIITPMELEIALGNLHWGEQAYTLDCQDVMTRKDNDVNISDRNLSESDDGSVDAPYFSLVTGGYVSKSIVGNIASAAADLDLKNLPGQGQVMEYKSEAATFLKQREYQGLESMIGQTEAKAAVQGLKGIASDYNGS